MTDPRKLALRNVGMEFRLMLEMFDSDFTKVADKFAEASSTLGSLNISEASGHIDSGMNGCRSRVVMEGYESHLNSVVQGIASSLTALETAALLAEADLTAQDEGHEHILRGAENYLDNVRDRLQSGTDYLANALGSGAEGVESGLRTIAEHSFGPVASVAGDAADTAGDFGDSVGDSAADLVDKVQDGAVDLAVDAADGLKDKILGK